MNHLINEIISNLENENYLSALTLTLLLPDICGKIQYPELQGRHHSRKRYVHWYNEFIYPYEKSPNNNDLFNEWVPDGDTLYLLRCSLLHEGSLNIENEVKKIKGIKDSINYKFILTDNFTSINLTYVNGDKNEEYSVLFRIGVEDLCKKICAVAENFFNEKCPGKDIYNNIIIFDFV